MIKFLPYRRLGKTRFIVSCGPRASSIKARQSFFLFFFIPEWGTTLILEGDSFRRDTLEHALEEFLQLSLSKLIIEGQRTRESVVQEYRGDRRWIIQRNLQRDVATYFGK